MEGNVVTPGPDHVAAGEALLFARRELKARAARTDLQTFIEFCMPDPEHFDDVSKSLYECRPVHKIMINHFVRTVDRISLRSGLSVPSQHGKTTIVAEHGLAWYAANNPTHNIIYGTYAEPRARIVGAAVRRIMDGDRFKEVFPEFLMEKGSKSKELIGFGDGGSVMFQGRNSGGSGNPCNLFVIDDPFKNHKEAKSKAVREECWDWFTGVVEARCPAHTPIFIVHTRWSDDDLLARLCDPEHPAFDPLDNDEYEYINIPGVIYEKDKELIELLEIDLCSMEEAKKHGLDLRAGTLWPKITARNNTPKYKKGDQIDHWPLWRYMSLQRKNKPSFSAMVMGNPVAPDGDLFKGSIIRKASYGRDDFPKSVRNYGAGDHAVSIKTRNDHTVLGTCGVCERGEIWIHPQLVWEKIETPAQVEKMAAMIKSKRPLIWWAEGDHIKKAIGPFLKKRLRKLRIFTTLLKELPKHSDKVAKAQPIIAMCDMGMVHLPRFAWWYEDAIKQMCRFDGSEGRPDDFVDFLANLGRGLDTMIDAPAVVDEEKLPDITGTAAWVRGAAIQDKIMKRKRKALEGW